MNILVKYKNDYINKNLIDFQFITENKLYLTNSDEQAIRIINKHQISKAVVEMSDLDEISLISYINQYHPTIEVVVITDSDNESILSAIKNGIFNIVEKPCNLEQILAEIS